MITYSIIKKSQLEGAKRLDAEYYQPEYLDMKKKLYPSPILEDISEKITDFGAYSQMNFVEYTKEGVRFFRNQDIGEVFVNDSDPVYISEETYKRLSLKLDKYDILTPRVGTLGNAAVVLNGYLPASANQNLAQIKPDIKKIDPVYLTVFLSSKFGRFQFEQLSTGNVQPWLNLSQLNSIKIFVPDPSEQKTIKDIANSALKELENSKSLYSQAENLLLEESGIKKNFKTSESLWSIVNLSDVKKANRMDADYFDPKYVWLQKILKNARPLSEIAERITKNIGIDPKGEYNYIEISDVDAGTGEISPNIIVGKDLPANAKIKVSGGEIIVSKVRPTRGSVAIIPDSWNKDFILSGAFSVFKIESPMRECLQVLLRSFVGKLQLEKPTTGTSYPTVTDQDVENILIPILPKPTQQKIAELVRKSHETRKKAKELLESAKRKVEEMIEKQD